MSTIQTTNLKHESSGSNNIVLDSSGNIAVQAGTVSAPAIQATGDSNTGIYFPAADTIAFAEGGSEAVRIDSSSRLLVGTSSARTAWNNTTIGANILQVERAGDAASTAISICANPGTSATETARLLLGRTRGNTVGATTVVASEDILGLVSFQGSDGTEMVEAAEIAAVVDGTPGANDMPCRLVFSTTADGASDPTERMRIHSNGDITLGTSTVAPQTGQGLKYKHNNGDRPEVFLTLNSSTNSDGSLYIYSLAASAYRFYVGMGGTVYATNTTISGISDARFKENVSDIDAGLAEVLSLKPRTFDWKPGKGKDVKGDRGFIAQEFEQVFPDLVDEWRDPAPEGEEPYKSVRQDLIPVLVKAIQEQQVMIAELQAEVAALKGA